MIENDIEPVMRGTLPFLSIGIILSICLLISPVPVSATQDISAYRVLQYDLQSSHFGSRQSTFSADARSLDADLLLRKCVFSRLEEVSEEKIQLAVSNEAAAFVIIVPDFEFVVPDVKQRVLDLEKAIIRQEVPIPVYLIKDSAAVSSLYEQTKQLSVSLSDPSASVVLKNAFFGTGHHVVVAGSQSKAISNAVFHNIQARIRAKTRGKNGQTPIVAFVAHYDAIGFTPALAFGADSNGSGVAALLELARIFAELKKTHDLAYDVLFLLTSGGKLNYLGAKKYLEDTLDDSDDSLQRNLVAAVCLDTIGNGDSIYFHVSKAPKEGSFSQSLLENLELASSDSRNVTLKTKKINLSDDFLAWEHERFNIRRLSGLTISGLESHLSPDRTTITDLSVDYSVLAENIKVLASAASKLIFKNEVPLDSLEISESSLKKIVSSLTANPRSNEYLVGNKVPLVSTLEDLLKKRSVDEIKTFQYKPEKKDPEVVVYDSSVVTMTVYETKPAAIDLVISVLLVGYVFILYSGIQNFRKIYKFLSVKPSKESPIFSKKIR